MSASTAQTAISRLPSAEQQAVLAEFEAIGRLEGVLDGNQLQPLNTATTVRVSNGELRVTRGSAVDSTAALDGYYL
jgi:hypothetical protein